MKKTLLAIALGALAVATTAQAGTNWYVQGDLGVNKLKATDSDLSKTTVSPSLAVGYDFGDVRVALDYTHYGKVNYGYTEVNGAQTNSATSSFKFQGAGVSAIYDININKPITPYVGARLALNQYKFNEQGVETTTANGANTIKSFTDSEKRIMFGYGLIAGAQYKLTDNLSLNGALEYNRLGHVDDVTIYQYGAKAGLRFDF